MNITSELNIKAPLTVSFPNEDQHYGNYCVCPKEVLQKSILEKKGKIIDYCGYKRKVKDVRITDRFIHMDLEVV